MKSTVLAALLVTAVLTVAVPVFAGPVNFNFSQHGNGDLGPGTIDFTAGGLDLNVTAWTSNGVQAHVYSKNNGGNEVGLGIAGTTNNEINCCTQFLQFDLATLKAEGATSITVAFNSTTNTEKWGLSYGSSNGVLNNSVYIAQGTTEGTTTTVLTNGGTYLDLSSVVTANASIGDGGNVLVASANVPSPEPTSLLLLGSGLVGMGTMVRRKKK